ncbi:hypothetical protein PoB_005610500 [Plakobranchus ocellatus]|uniref:Uncharacterized protein n=1 Tax=Plakobranchus ocellatus TaxID=259542 RepID=A0AAV4CD71_9GAST|nr:hypothetical protein PoB_005610500 [Plakobranchus ocellatus]
MVIIIEAEVMVAVYSGESDSGNDSCSKGTGDLIVDDNGSGVNNINRNGNGDDNGSGVNNINRNAIGQKYLSSVGSTTTGASERNRRASMFLSGYFNLTRKMLGENAIKTPAGENWLVAQNVIIEVLSQG